MLSIWKTYLCANELKNNDVANVEAQLDVLNVVDTMKMIEENMGLKDIEEENKLESVYMLNAYYVDYTKHKFNGYMHEK